MRGAKSTFAYAAARQGIAIADTGGHGWLRVTGRDRLDFLQRLSTNDLRGLAVGGGLPTVLCSAIGRVIALLVALAGEDALFLRTAPEQGQPVTRYLQGLIFWGDEVEIADASAEMAQIGMLGPRATQALTALADKALDDIAPYYWAHATIAGHDLMIQRGGALELADWTLIVPAAYGENVRAALRQVGPTLDRPECDALRIEAGIPAWGREFGEQATPLETGLEGAISANKGCYTGQEVIARQLNYDKVTRILAGLLLPETAEVAGLAGAPVRAAGGRTGYVGSATWSPQLDRPIAMAVVPRDAAAPGSMVTVLQDGKEITATVARLPFVRRPGSG